MLRKYGQTVRDDGQLHGAAAQVDCSGHPAEQMSAILRSMTNAPDVATAPLMAGGDNLESLLQAIVGQDESAFEAFYDATIKRVYGIALRITQLHDVAEEVVSDVYLQVWRQANRYDAARGGPMAWLSVLCRSRALDAMRQRKTSSYTQPLDAVERESEGGPYAQDVALATERNTAVHAALQTLDERQRQLLALAYFRDFSHSELARFTGLPIGTVKTLLRRAMLVLKESMADFAGTLGDAHD